MQLVVLDDADSLALWRLPWRGRERLFLTRAGLTSDGTTLTLTSEDPADLVIGVFPPLTDGQADDGIFQTLALPVAATAAPSLVTVTAIRKAGPPREIVLGWTTPPVAVAPTAADFAAAAAWRLDLPTDLDLALTPRLRLHYRGDVARVKLGERLILDDFSNGTALELDLRSHADALVADTPLTVEILPVPPGAPILWPAGIKPDADIPVAQLDLVELVRIPTTQF